MKGLNRNEGRVGSAGAPQAEWGGQRVTRRALSVPTRLPGTQPLQAPSLGRAVTRGWSTRFIPAPATTSSNSQRL